MAVQLDVRQGVVLRPAEGEPLFGGRILIKASFDELCVTETVYDRARDGASPHYHRHHADSFYVLEGELAVLVHDEERVLGPGGYVCIPPEVVLLAAGEGGRLEANDRVATIKAGREELALIELEYKPGFEGPSPHHHDDHVDSFYVVEGEADFLMGEETIRLGAGSFVAAPRGVVHAFSIADVGPARLLNVHAPSTGFHERLR